MTNKDLALRLDEDMRFLEDVMLSLNVAMTDHIGKDKVRLMSLVGRARRYIDEARELLLTAIEDELGEEKNDCVKEI